MAEDLVMVTWRDAYFDFDAPDEGDEREDYLVHTVGYLVGEDAKFIHVAAELLPDGDGYRAITHIPQPIVLTVVTIMPVLNVLKSLPSVEG